MAGTRSRRVQKLAGFLATLPLFCACSLEQSPAGGRELPELPDGAVVAGDADAFRRLLAGVELLRGSPAGRGAAILRGRLARCEEFSASLAPGDALALADLADTVSCDRAPLEDPALRALRGTSDIVFVLPVGGEGRIAGSASVDAAGSLVVEAEFLELPAGHWARLLAPDFGAAGPHRLSDDGALVSGRFRPAAGLDLAALVPGGSQADQMFRLKSAIFQGTALSGAWEFALYAPAERTAMPLLALSVDVRVQSAALEGMREFVAELESTWPVQHRAVQFGVHAGACFFELRILPEFSPCYAVTPEAIVIGWNREAIELALSRVPDASSFDRVADAAASQGLTEHAAELVVRFGELSAADHRLRGVLAPDTAALELDYFWDRLAVVSGRREASPSSLAAGSGSVWLRARLRAAAAAGPEPAAVDAS